MGQAGSVEQRNAIRDVVTLKPASADPEAVSSALRAFCKMFPVEAAVVTASTATDDASGIVLDVKENKLFHVVHALLQHATERTEKNSREDLIELTLTSFKRVILWRELYRLGSKCSMKPFLNCLLLSPALARSALQVLLSLTGVCPSGDTTEKTEKWESLNRRNFAESGGYDVLRSLIVEHGSSVNDSREHESVLALVLELFHSALVTRKHTTDGITMSHAVGALLNARISLLNLCHHSHKLIQDFALDLVKELFFVIDLEQVHELQESAREYGALLYALSVAVAERKKSSSGSGGSGKVSRESSRDSDSGGELTPTNSARALQEKLTELVEMFCAGNTRSKKVISRILPVELFIPQESRADLISRHTASSLLKSTRNNRSLPSFTFDFELRSSLDGKKNRGTSFATGVSKQVGLNGSAFEKWLQDARSQGEDWKSIIEAALVTHEGPELVWKDAMRAELRQAIREEIDRLEREKSLLVTKSPGAIVRWDHEMFFVEYHSIQKELVVNGYFVEFLIPMLGDLTNQFEVLEPLVLAWHLSDRLAVERYEPWKILCLRCLRLTIRRYAMVLNGQLPTRQVLELLRDHSNYSPAFIRECFMLLNTAFMTTRNAPSESLNQISTSIAMAVVDVLSDSTLISSLSHKSSSKSISKDDDDDVGSVYDFDEENVQIRNGSDGLVRAGVSVLQAIIRRSKFILQFVRPRRVFICRLLAVETLDHVTVSRILSVLKQLAHLDSSVTTSSHSTNTGTIQTHSSSKSAADINWKSIALVYILIACCDPNGNGMSLAAAQFLKDNYCVLESTQQLKSLSPSSTSYSRRTSDAVRERKRKSEFKQLLDDAVGFDGCGIGSLLGSCDASLFCEVFNAEEKRSADVWWGRRQRAKVFNHLKRKFVASATSSNQLDDYDAVIVSADGDSDEGSTDGIGDEIFVGNIFLRSYVEGDGEFLNDWTDDMYRALIDALFARLSDLSRTRSVFGPGDSRAGSNRSPIEPAEVQEFILKALVRLLPSHCLSVEIKSESFETLLLPLRRSLLGDTDQVRGSLAIELLIALLHVPEDKCANASLCRKFLSESGLTTIAEALEKMMNPAYQRLLKAESDSSSLNFARVLLSRVTDLLTTLSAEQEGVSALKKNPSVIAALLDLSSKQNITSYSAEAAATCLLCLSKLCQDDDLLNLMIGAGGLLQLIEVCAFCPVGNSLVESPVSPRLGDADESNNPASPKEEDAKQRPVVLSLPPSAAAVRSAAETLKSCLYDSEGAELVLSVQVLKQLLTPSFVRILRVSPTRFVLRLQAKEDICCSTLIWNSTMKKRLADTLTSELLKVKTAAKSNVWPRWNPDHFVAADSFRYQYPELNDELIVHDVYINKFVSSDGVALDDIDMSAFSQALLISIQSGENVLRILQQRGASDPTKERSIVVMRLALNKLVSAHPQHNLQVDRTPATSIGMTSLIENESSDEESDDDDDASTAGSSVGGYRVHPDNTIERSSTLDPEDLIV